MRFVIKKYDSVGQFALRMREAKTSRLFANKKLASIEDGASWSGTSSYDEADKLLRGGDKASYEMLKKAISQIKVKGNGTTQRREVYANVVGFAPIVPNAVQGLPLSMMQTRTKVRTSNKVVNIVYNAGVSVAWSAEDIAKVGAQVLDYVREVEAGGSRVNLYIMFASKSSSEVASAIIKVKDSTQYMDVLRCAYPMVNPSMLRRHFLRFVETADLTDKHFTIGYGSVVKDKGEIKDVLKDIKCDKYIDAYSVFEDGKVR